jgi:putative glycosyl hydrolase
MLHARTAGVSGKLEGSRGIALLVAGVVVAIAVIAAGVSGADARKARHRHHRHHAGFAKQLRSASAARARADRSLVRRAHRVRRCTHSLPPHHCGDTRRALQRAGLRLARAEARLARLATKPLPARNTARTPGLRALGGVLKWHRVRHAHIYMVVRKVPGQPDQFLVTRRTAIRPPAVPGQTVRYSARAAVAGSSWAPEVAIGYRPAASRRARQTAPTVHVVGHTLRWNRVGKVGTYVLVATSAGRTNRYSEVSGTHATPAATGGATANYSVRTAVAGSAWSVPVSVSYAAPAPAPAPSSMVVGLNAGNFGSKGAADVKNVARAVRLDSGVGGSAVRNFTNIGVKVDVDFSGPYNGGGVSALNAAGWVSSTLSFYKTYCTPAMCPWIEVLNEPGGTWFWGSNAPNQTNAAAYRSLLQQTWNAFHAAYGAAAPKVLATVDGSNALQFGQNWWTPAAAAFVDGIVVHPYGGTGDRGSSALGNRQRVIDAHNLTGEPIYPTEFGWPTCQSCSSTSDSLQWSTSDQATNLTNFIEWARGTGFVPALFYFNYRDFGGGNAYGIETQSGGRKPSYAALQAEAAK